jgi:hypothetical protein
MAASSHPSRHEREVERGATSRPRAERPRCAGGRSGATTVIVESQPQRTASAVPAPSVVVGADATLLVARQLLNNPPPSGASPSATEEWRRNVDQLVIAAINTPLHERRCQPSAQYSHTPPVAHASSVACAPPVEHAPPVRPDARQMVRHRAPMVSYATADLRAEINRRCGGEDGRATIERRRERRRDIEGRNLEKDFDSHASSLKSPSAREAYPPSSPGVTGGVGGAWRWHHICGWWSGRASSGPTCRRSMMGPSTPLSSCRSTPPLSLRQGGMRPLWPTTSLLP